MSRINLSKITPDSYAPGASPATAGHPFQVHLITKEDGSKGWFKVELNSTLTHGIGPLDKITITNLDTELQIPLDGEHAYIWLKVDLNPTYATPPGLPTATIETGENWNGEDGSFFPAPVKFDTDDGSLMGSEGTPPSDRRQTHFYVPIAERITHSDSDPYEPRDAQVIDGEKRLHQLLKTHLTMMGACYAEEDSGAVGVQYARPGLTHFYHTDLED